MSSSQAPRRRLRQLIGIPVACLLGVTVAVLVTELFDGSAAAPRLARSELAPSAYRGAPEAPGLGQDEPSSQPTNEEASPPLPPELEARLLAAAHVSTVPSQPGAPLPPTTPLTGEQETSRQQALAGFATEVQALLDRCVGRPATLRRPARLDVILQPPLVQGALVAQQLTPAAVSLPPDELRRLWQDTDPDALQSCLEQVRMLAITVPAPSATEARVLPAAFESMPITL